MLCSHFHVQETAVAVSMPKRSTKCYFGGRCKRAACPFTHNAQMAKFGAGAISRLP